MNRTARIYKVLIVLAGICTAAAAVFLYFAQTVGYDLSIQHFARNSLHARGAAVSIVLSAILGLAAGIACRRMLVRTRLAPPSAVLIFSASVTAFLMLAVFILSIRQLSQGLPLLEIFRLILMALSAAFFFLVTSREKKGDGFALLSLCPMMYAFISVLSIYFDTSYGMNSPLKSYYLLLYLSMALFFSAEARTVIRGIQPLTYTFFAVLCFTASASLGLSQLAIALYDTVGHGFSVIDSALCIAVALFALARLISLGKETPAETAPAETADTEKEEDDHGTEEADGNAD